MNMESRTRALDKVYKRRDRYDIPEWQRQKVWTLPKRQRLVDSILRGWKLPKFYFLRVSDDPEQYEVVDGQQRLAAIFAFFDGELALSDASAKEFGARKYSELPDPYEFAFDDYEIEYDEIQDATDEEVKDFFQRLQEGVRLTSSEKLNSVHSKLCDFVRRLTNHAFFSKVAVTNSRYGYFDILAKVAAIEIDGPDVGLRYDDLKRVFESQAKFSARSNVAMRLKSVLDFADAGFESKCSLLRNRTVVQSLLSFVCRLLQSGKAEGHEKDIAGFFTGFLAELKRQVELGQEATDPDYVAFQRTVNANVRAGAKIRQEILLRKFVLHEAGFAEMLDPAAVAESGLTAAITRDAEKVVALVGDMNEQWAARTGDDLFKITNKVTRALARLGKPVQDHDDYSRFVDDLYFVFHEGAGNRLQGRRPKSLHDVNLLRTGLRHDLNHGGTSKARTTKRKVGQAFKRYAGEVSPAGLAPERFIVVQANVLSAIRKDLAALKP